MVCALVLATLWATPKTIDILFLGNSHTMVNDVPSMVKALVESDSSDRTVRVKIHGGAFLNDIAQSPQVRQDIESGQFEVVVMQAAKLSSSHRYQYSHDGGIQLAKLARQKGARVLLFAEWPRKGWDETAYILGQYGMIAKPSGAEIVPVCKVWDSMVKQRPNEAYWAGDGNHAQLAGSFIAATSIAIWLAEPKSTMPTYTPRGLDTNLSLLIKKTTKRILEN